MKWTINGPFGTEHVKVSCTTIYRYSVLCKVYTEYHGTSELEHGLCACALGDYLSVHVHLGYFIGHRSFIQGNLQSVKISTLTVEEEEDLSLILDVHVYIFIHLLCEWY